LLPGLPGWVGLPVAFLSVTQLDEDAGLGAPVSDLADDSACLLVAADGIVSAAMVMAGFGEFL
jgi:hypothetical protein